MEELAQPTTPSSPLADRLALKTSKTEECWNWTGSKDWAVSSFVDDLFVDQAAIAA